jgi:hypothetical protein
MSPGRTPELRQALKPVPHFERAVREVSRLFSEAGIRHVLAGALAANAYRDRPRTTEDIDFLVGDEAFETHPNGLVTIRVPVIEFDGIEIDQVLLTDTLRVVEDALDNAPRSEGIPIAPMETIVIMKLLAGRTQDLADIEAIISAGADRELLTAAVTAAAPERVTTLQRLFGNVDRI